MESSENADHTSFADRIHFRGFTFDPSSGDLWGESGRIRLRRQPAKLLALLASNQGQVVTRAQIRQALWGNNTYIDFDQGINWCVREVRKALGDDSANASFIETISKQGYRFLATCSPAERAVPIATRRASAVFHEWKLAVGTIFALMLIAGMLAFRVASKTPTVLVLPLDNFTGEARGGVLADASTDYLIASLGANPRLLRVIDRPTAAKFKKTGECIIKIGEQLHADYVFVGSIDTLQSGPQLSAGLFRVADNKQVWARAGIDPAKDQVMAEIPRAIIASLR